MASHTAQVEERPSDEVLIPHLPEEAQALIRECLNLFREVGDKRFIAWSLLNLGRVASHQDDFSTAQTLLEESLSLFKELGEKRGIPYSLLNLGMMARKQGDYSVAQAYSEKSLVIFREIGDRSGIAWSLYNLGRVASDQDDTSSAQTYYEESLTLWREIGDRNGIVWSLRAFAGLAAKESKSEQAVVLWGAAEALREDIRAPLPSNERELYDRGVAAARQALGDELFTTVWAKGRAMTLEEAIALALKSPVS